jgi:ABC-type branched-subunit amino acid transport system ATPase component
MPAASAEGPAEAQVRDVFLGFDGHRVLNGISFELPPGQITLLRGENGSGKTVLLNVLCGYIAVDEGFVRLKLGGEWIDASRCTPERLARRGVGRMWQDIRLFPTMTVLDNVLVATPKMLGENPALALFARPAVVRQERAARERAFDNLNLVGMVDRAHSSCDMLSVGQMKRVAIARLLQMGASLLLLDEPFAGLDAAGAASFARDLDRLRSERQKTILVIEHRPDAISDLVDRIWTLRDGRIEKDRSHG